jgi:hypothetical protein
VILEQLIKVQKEITTITPEEMIDPEVLEANIGVARPKSSDRGLDHVNYHVFFSGKTTNKQY